MEWPSRWVGSLAGGVIIIGSGFLHVTDPISAHNWKVAITFWVVGALIFICGSPSVQRKLRIVWDEAVAFSRQAASLSPRAVPLGAIIVVVILFFGGLRLFVVGDSPSSSISAAGKNDRPASRDIQRQPKEGTSSAAEKAADHYRRTSLSLKKEEVRQGYRVFCAQLAERFNLTKWSDINQLTQMIDVNMGDTDAYEQAEKAIPGTAWVAMRILVAFETPQERPMYMSYIFIGRAADGDEVVALYNELHQWNELSRSSKTVRNHEELMTETAKQELARLTEKIAEDIERLR